MRIILAGKALLPQEQELMLDVLEYINKVYGQKRRILGPLSVLHPLRAAALLSRAMPQPALLDLITELLHDHFEDNKPSDIRSGFWFRTDSGVKKLLKPLSEPIQDNVMNWLTWLTRPKEDTYYRYIGRLLDESRDSPQAIRVKLADRLDNTLDMRIDFQDPIAGIDFFETIFQILFINSYKGYKPESPHPPRSAINGAERLFQLFKNIVLMSLIRQKHSAQDDPISQSIFDSLASAGVRESQRIVLHIFGYHEAEIRKIRNMILDTMEYVQKGGIDTVTAPAMGHRLDGLIISSFDDADKRIRTQKLELLYADKPLMVETALAFIVIFLNFLNDPNYFVRGISEEGVRPESI